MVYDYANNERTPSGFMYQTYSWATANNVPSLSSGTLPSTDLALYGATVGGSTGGPSGGNSGSSIAEDDFESNTLGGGTGWGTNNPWTSDASSTYFFRTKNNPDGSGKVLNIRSNTMAHRSTILNNEQDITLSFDWFIDASEYESGDYAEIYVIDSSGMTYPLLVLDKDSLDESWEPETFNLSNLNISTNGFLDLVIDNHANAGAEELYLDNVKIFSGLGDPATTGSISGFVLNGNSGLAGVTIELKDTNGSVVSTENTDSTGYYNFTDVAPGDYDLAQIQPGNFTTVSDGDTTNPNDDGANTSTTDNLIPVSVVAGEADDGNEFIEQSSSSGTIATQDVAVEDSFSGGTGWSGPWTTSSGYFFKVASWDGTRALTARADGSGTRAVDLSGYGSVTLTYTYLMRSSLYDSGETAQIECFDGSSWTTLKTYDSGSPNVIWTDESSISIPTSALNSSFQIRIKNNANQGKEQIFIRELTLSGS